MNRIQSYQQYLNEKHLNEREDSGLFFGNSPKNKNKFLFLGEIDTLIIPIKRAKAIAGKQVIGNNYDFKEFAISCNYLGPQIGLGKDRYDIYPEFTLTVPNITEMTFSELDPVIESKAILTYTEAYIQKFWQRGLRRDGYYWMMEYGGSVKVNIKTIRERFEELVGMFIREANVRRINWEGLNLQYKDHVFNPLVNKDDLKTWLQSWWISAELAPAYKALSELNLPNSLTIKVRTNEVKD
jgi:hypothetical protein